MNATIFDRSYKDSGISKLLNMLRGLENSDSKEVQAIVTAVEELKEYLQLSDEKELEHERRVNMLLETLLKFTVLDFSEKADIGELGDDLDAIAVGINTLAEELELKINTEVQNAERLREQNIKLERMNKELSSFAYVSSHDLQEPLRKINTYISRIEEEKKDVPEQISFYLDRIHSAASRMQNLIRDILDYSKLTNSGSTVALIDPNPIIKEVLADFEERLKENNATFNCEPICKVRIVEFQFKRVLSNLLSNSLKFKSKDRPLTIHLGSDIEKVNQVSNMGGLAAGNYCHLKYSDNGIGFSGEYNEKVFEVFQRLHNQSDYEGTGVGLAICRRIIENHGGVITANGNLGSGVTFDIYLPVE